MSGTPRWTAPPPVARTQGPTIVSGTRRVFAIGDAVIEAAISGGMCGVCFGTGGDHSARCLVAEALRFDPVLRRRLGEPETLP